MRFARRMVTIAFAGAALVGGMSAVGMAVAPAASAATHAAAKPDSRAWNAKPDGGAWNAKPDGGAWNAKPDGSAWN